MNKLFKLKENNTTVKTEIVAGFTTFMTMAYILAVNPSITNLKLTEENYTSAIPAYLCIIAMPLFYSIAEGISIGIISYVVLNLAAKKWKDISPVMYVLAVLFILKYVFL